MSVAGLSMAGAAELNVAGVAELNVAGPSALGLSRLESSMSELSTEIFSASSSGTAGLSSMGSSSNPIIVDDDEDNNSEVDGESGEGVKFLGFIDLT